MGYILMDESLFKVLMDKILIEDVLEDDLNGHYFWMNSDEVCEYLKISIALLNTYRKNNVIMCCTIKGKNHFKRADVYKLKNNLNAELIKSGVSLAKCDMISTEEQAIKRFNRQDECFTFNKSED